MMEEEKKKQDLDLDRMLKARLDRRKKRLDGRGKAAVKEEQKVVEQAIQADITADTKAKVEAAEQEAEKKLHEVKASQPGDPAAYRERAEQVRKEKEQELERLEKEAEVEKQERIKEAAEEVRRKHAQGAQTTEELERDLIKIIGEDDPEATSKLDDAK